MCCDLRVLIQRQVRWFVVIMQCTHTNICTLGQTVYLLYIIRVNLYLGIKITLLMYLVFTNQKPVRLRTENRDWMRLIHTCILYTTYNTHYSLLNPQNMWYATVFRYFSFFALFHFILISFHTRIHSSCSTFLIFANRKFYILFAFCFIFWFLIPFWFMTVCGSILLFFFFF